MYIRRKVFSLLQDETGEERYYSTTDFDLDVEERVFAEAEEEPKKGLSKGAKIGIGVGGGLAATAAGIVGAKYAGKALLKKGAKLAESADGAAKAAKYKKAGEALQVPADYIVDKSGKVWKFVGDNAKKAGEFVNDKAKKAVEKTKGVFSKKKQ
jgi:hypothetical protein